MRVLLIFPPATIFPEEDAPHVFPLGIGYLAAVLQNKGYEVKVLDCLSSDENFTKNEDGTLHVGLTWEQITHEIENFRPGVVGISCLWTADYPNAKKISELVKEVGDIPVIFGGAHTTALPRQVLSNETVDYVVIGEGEVTLPRLLKHLGDNGSLSKIPGLGCKMNGTININPINEYILDLDQVPFPARHLFPMENYLSSRYVHNYIFKRQPHAQMITSRGCPLNCTFCTIHSIWGKKVRFRSAENVVDEIQFLVKKYKVKEIHFEDDNISINPKRMQKICEEIIKRKLDITWTAPNGMYAHTLSRDLLKIMKASGCYRVSIGIENGNQDFLRNVCKKAVDLAKVRAVVKDLNDLKIESTGFFMLGIPGETKHTMKETIEFAKSLDLDYAIFSIYSPYPGTEMYDLAVSKGYLPHDIDYARFKNKYSTLNTEFLSAREVERYRNKALFELEINKILHHPIRYFSNTENYKTVRRYFKRYLKGKLS
jgi:magnesium-protoporphyrin IX monomethyl ester (oxidative) cyclase